MVWNNLVLKVWKISLLKFSELDSCVVDFNNLLISSVEIGLCKLSLFSGVSLGKLYTTENYLFSGVNFGKLCFLVYYPYHHNFSFICRGLCCAVCLSLCTYIYISYIYVKFMKLPPCRIFGCILANGLSYFSSRAAFKIYFSSPF